MADRLDTVVAILRLALAVFRNATTPGALSAEVAYQLRLPGRLGPREAEFGCVVFWQAMDPADREEMTFLIGGIPPMGEPINEHNRKRKPTGRENGLQRVAK